MALVDLRTLGIQGQVLVGSVGSTPSVALGDDIEANLNVANAMAKYATRGQKRMNSRCTTQELSADFTCIKDAADASFILLRTAAMAGTPVAIKFLDKTSGYGWDGDWNVSMKESQPLEGWTSVQFECAFTSDHRALTEINPS